MSTQEVVNAVPGNEVVDPFAVAVMRQSVKQMLEREICVPPRHRFAERDCENDFKVR